MEKRYDNSCTQRIFDTFETVMAFTRKISSCISTMSIFIASMGTIKAFIDVETVDIIRAILRVGTIRVEVPVSAS